MNKDKKIFLVSIIIPIFAYFYFELFYQIVLSDLITYVFFSLKSLSSANFSLINRTAFNLILESIHYLFLLGTFLMFFIYRNREIRKGNSNFIEDGFLEMVIN